MDLIGKAALVTGGGVGTGRAIALALAERGCHVAVNYSRSRAEAEATAAEIRGALGARAFAVEADVSDDAAVRAMIARTVGELGRLDVLVNNAAVTSFIAHADLEGVTDEVWDRILGVNLKGSFQVVRAAAPALKESRGVVVNVSSIAGIAGVGSSIPYCASKAALNIMTVALARALAPEIRVNAVAPGFIDTRWWKDREGYDMVKNFSTEKSPLKRICQPEDIATLVLGLIDSELVTGQVVVIDGGMTLAG
jgi:3-oxoacyl-[acyl-carrier protein] reductase